MSTSTTYRKEQMAPSPIGGLFLCSFSTLAFEIALTRVFSIALWHHLAFMIISIAMLGIGASGTLQSLIPRLRRPAWMGLYAMGLAISIPLSYALTNVIPLDPVRLQWEPGQAGYVGLYYALLAVPFGFFGLLAAATFSAYSERSGLVYGADLLGAGTGGALVLPLIGAFGLERTIPLLSLIALAGAFLLGWRRASAALSVPMALAAVFIPHAFEIRVSPYKDLSQALRYPGARHLERLEDGYSRVDVFESPMVRFAPGLSLTYLGDLPPQKGLSVDASDAMALTTPGNHPFLHHLPAALPYEMRARKRVLVAGAGGGLGVLLARSYEAEEIHAVEANSLLARAADIHAPGVYNASFRTGLARNFLLSGDERYDLIELSLTRTLPIRSFGLSEDYRYTMEAFRTYISHLTEDGTLSITLYLTPPPRKGFRLLTTGIAALKSLGSTDQASHIAAIRTWGTLTLLIKASPLTDDEIEGLKRFALREGFDLVAYPGMDPAEGNRLVVLPEDIYVNSFSSLLDPSARANYIREFPFDLRPPTDERPFFARFIRTTKLKVIYEQIGRKWQFFILEGYLLPLVLAQAALVGAVLMLLPALRWRGKVISRSGEGNSRGLAYFALLGLGFLFVEVPLIQRMTLPFESPHRAVAIVLAAVLVSSGLGSFASERIVLLRHRAVPLALAVAAALSALATSSTAGLAAYPLALRIVLAVLVIFPPAFLMGIPFPLGMRVLGQRQPALIPWAWAVNGCFSVLAPILAGMMAPALGFGGVLLLGAAVYALAYLAGAGTLFSEAR